MLVNVMDVMDTLKPLTSECLVPEISARVQLFHTPLMYYTFVPLTQTNNAPPLRSIYPKHMCTYLTRVFNYVLI